LKRATLSTAAALVAASSPTLAQESVPVQQFAPATGGDTNYLATHGSRILPHLKPSVGLFVNYAKDPLILRRVSNGEQVELLANQLQLDLVAALGLGDMFELGLAIPLTVYQSAGDVGDTLAPRPLDVSSAGDLRLIPKLSLFGDPEGFGLALLMPITLPTGSPENLQGNETITLEPRIAMQYVMDANLRVALNAGFLFRPQLQTLYNIAVGNELTAGLAAEYRFDRKPFGQLAIIFDTWARLSLESDTATRTIAAEERPIEAGLAARYWPIDNHAVTLGVSRGLTKGYGSPDFRLIAGYTYTPVEDPDPDRDGVYGATDGCPLVAEDLDRFNDTDGCPDPDNDGDGLLDVDDKCPLVREDFDGFEDLDGCPDEDPDSDGDGLLDRNDACPQDPEDKDAHEDQDGCPDPDNDKDGVCDPWVSERGRAEALAATCAGVDACLNEPEDKDGFQDEDGCPDPDNDGDGILDLDDDCPDQPGEDCRARLVGKCEIEILDQVFFKYDRDVIDEVKSAPILTAVADVLKQHTWIRKVEIQGHTDSDGPAGYNKDLSQRRSEQVRKFLVEKGGVEADRLVGKGYGEFKPLMSNDTPAGRAKNRRVQFMILEPGKDECQR
jgi:outer membrane protein OmpA-like peptidoglycan-associated protein